MESFFASGRAIDLVLAVLAIEAILLTARGHKPLAVFAMLMPAALILLAMRAALVGAPWPQMALLLALSFPVHLADLRLRFARNRSDED